MNPFNLSSPRYQLRAIVVCAFIVALGAFAVFAITGCSNTKTEKEEPLAAAGSEVKASRTEAQPDGPSPPQLELHPSLKDRKFDAAIRDVVVRENPVIDGWEIEHFNELAMRQLKKLGKLLCNPEKIVEKSVADLCSPKFSAQELRPANKTTVVDDSGFVVLRASEIDSSSAGTVSGVAGFVESLKKQASIFTGGDCRSKFKVIRVILNDDRTAETTAFFELNGPTTLGQGQVNATWKTNWELPPGEELPRLLSISVSNYEEVVAKNETRKAFVDCTQAAFAGHSILDEQFVYGRDHWYGNLEATIGVEGRGNGIAIGDANGDGLEDIYFCQPAALPNRLFLRRQDGSMQEVSASAGVDWLDSTRAALFVDIDNDGDQDLLTTQSTNLVLQENMGVGNFEVKQILQLAARLFSLNAVDFDNDGDLDIYVCAYSGAANSRPEDIFVSPVPYHDANNGAPNVLLRNEGGWTFTNVTSEVGLDANNLRFSLASAWDDFDNDGDLDLYVANDFGRNNLFRNDRGRFVDIAGAVGVEDIGPGMSAAWGDQNNDGHADIYVSNMFSSAGSRITHHAQFKPEANQTDLLGFKRHARGNSLFRNLGNGRFSDDSVSLGITLGRWAWGSLFVDINNDGWQDVYVTNGFVTADNNNDL